MGRPLGAQRADFFEGPLQHVLVEEEDRGKGLVLRPGGDPLAQRQVRQESLGLLLWRKVVGLREAKVIEAANPVAVGVLGAERIVKKTDPLPHHHKNVVPGFHERTGVQLRKRPVAIGPHRNKPFRLV